MLRDGETSNMLRRAIAVEFPQFDPLAGKNPVSTLLAQQSALLAGQNGVNGINLQSLTSHA
jgi:hypothetical protein